jgi:hypothetical protein
MRTATAAAAMIASSFAVLSRSSPIASSKNFPSPVTSSWVFENPSSSF